MRTGPSCGALVKLGDREAATAWAQDFRVAMPEVALKPTARVPVPATNFRREINLFIVGHCPGQPRAALP
jgi:hypothetical protein